MGRVLTRVDAPGRDSYDDRPMKLAILAAAAAVLATSAVPARAQTTSSTPSSSSARAKKSQAAPAKPPEKLSPTDAKAKEYDLAKVKFLSAVGACSKPEECDPNSPRKVSDLVKMLQGSEDAFMEACQQCATDEQCAQERDRIKAGRARTGQNPCLVATQKAKGESDKKKGTSASPEPKSASTADKKAAGSSAK